MSHKVKCYELAVGQQLAMQNALEQGEREKFLHTLREYPLSNLVTGVSQDPEIVSGYIILLKKAVKKWILGEPETKEVNDGTSTVV